MSFMKEDKTIKLTCLKNLSLLKELLRKLSNLSFNSSKFWGKKGSTMQSMG